MSAQKYCGCIVLNWGLNRCCGFVDMTGPFLSYQSKENIKYAIGRWTQYTSYNNAKTS